MSSRSGLALLAAGIAGCMLSSSCVLPHARAAQDFGIPPCPAGAEKNLLSADALQCWFTASHGRWRTLNHQSHLEALVVDVEARDVRDGQEIARRIVEGPSASAFTEILVYVARPARRELRVRRVRWTVRTGFETLDYTSPAGDSPLIVRLRK
jgi:hypothetical protein